MVTASGLSCPGRSGRVILIRRSVDGFHKPSSHLLTLYKESHQTPRESSTLGTCPDRLDRDLIQDPVLTLDICLQVDSGMPETSKRNSKM